MMERSSNPDPFRVYSTNMWPILFLLTLVPVWSFAQHCAFDLYSIIAVRPQAYGDTNVIDGLRVMLLDKDNLPATATGTPFYLFQRNTERPRQWTHPSAWRRNGKRQFPFAQDNYVLVVPNHFHMENYRVLVMDERPGNDGPRYRQQLLHLHPTQCKPLCGRYDDEVYQAGPDELPFRPVSISLFER